MSDPRILMFGPGSGCKGGMSAVLASYSRMPFWKKYGCVWLATVGSGGRLGKMLVMGRCLLQAIRMLPGSDLVHLHVAPRRSFYRKAFFIWLSRAYGKIVIAHVHAGDFGSFWAGGSSLRRRFVSATMGCARLLIAVSEPLAEDLRKCAPGLSVVTMPNPFDQPAIQRRESPPCPNVLFAGRIEADKGTFDLIRAFALVRRTIPGARLVLAGEGNLAEANAIAKQLGLNGSIEFPGWLTEAALEERYAAASVFCLPSYVEGMPVVVLQAMAAGVPVVATGVGGVPDLLGTDAGIIVPPGDVSELAGQLIRVLGNEQLQNSLSLAANRALAAHHPERVSDLLEATYLQLLKKPPSRLLAPHRV